MLSSDSRFVLHHAAVCMALVALTAPTSRAETLQPVRAGQIDRSARPTDARHVTGARPAIDPELAATVAAVAADTPLRVVVELAAPELPGAVRAARRSYAAELTELERRARAIRQRSRAKGALGSEHDPDADRRLTGDDRRDMAIVNAEHERLSRLQHRAVATASRRAVGPVQDRVAAQLGTLGGTVRHRLESFPVLVATVPAGRLAELAALPQVLHVAPSRVDWSQLDTADNALRMGSGPWGDGHTGGTWDPAVLDSGTDLAHPGLQDSGTRTNFSSYYLVDASFSSCYADTFSVDDTNGHGTHVMGIVASEGTPNWTSSLGMAYGVEKAVSLKAAFHCSSNGRSSMYRTDAMSLVDRALSSPEDLEPAGTFNDDIDGINLSFGSIDTTDDTNYARFWDSVVASFNDLPVTIAAGNDGPAATTVNAPSTAYNVISVANVDDQNTATRDDDVVASSSSRGPTLGGRRKPDLAAPGSDIRSANNDWEDELDYVDKTGTSMAAPAVLGTIMTLMDAGLTDELALKAVLINHARKNDVAIDFDDTDADGWDPAYGWGYVNADQSHFHVDDVFTGAVTESGEDGDFDLYTGFMQDNSTEGRDRVTLVWNREASYLAESYPTQFSDLADLDLYLYDSATVSLVDSDTTDIDNVHQVRRDPASSGDVVVKVAAADADFPHGGAEQSYALATEEGFTAVPYPASFSLDVTAPAAVAAGQQFDVTVELTNDSQLTTTGNGLVVSVPDQVTLVSGGTSVFASGPMSPGETGIVHTWTFETTSSATVAISHLHGSYGELWSEGYDLVLTVETPLFADGFESGDTTSWSAP